MIVCYLLSVVKHSCIYVILRTDKMDEYFKYGGYKARFGNAAEAVIETGKAAIKKGQV